MTSWRIITGDLRNGVLDELDDAVDAIIEAHGRALDRSAFDAVAPMLGAQDRLWARYLMAARQHLPNTFPTPSQPRPEPNYG